MPNWETLLSLFEGQGMLFWTAAAAASLGASLLVCAGILELRRRLTGGAEPGPTPAAAAPSPAPVLAKPAGTGYAPAGPAHLHETAPRPPDAAIGPLLARLRTAGDLLAALQGAGPGPDSSLKGSAKSVDYVFRSSVG